MEIKHTPTTFYGWGESRLNDGFVYPLTKKGLLDRENHVAKFSNSALAQKAIRACNAHEQLLEACEYALWVLTDGLEGHDHGSNPNDLVVLRDAIAKGRAA